MSCIECKVIVKDEHKKLAQSFLLYEPLTLDLEDRHVKKMIQDTLDQFKVEEGSEPPSIVIKATMVVQ